VVNGLSTMGDGNQIFMFSFGPLSGLADIAAGHAGTQFPNIFNTPYSAVSNLPLSRGDPATSDGATSGNSPWTGAPGPFTPGFTWNGAVGLAPDVANVVSISNLVEGAVPAGATVPGCPTGPGAGALTGLVQRNRTEQLCQYCHHDDQWLRIRYVCGAWNRRQFAAEWHRPAGPFGIRMM
jgi:hypothetical protein